MSEKLYLPEVRRFLHCIQKTNKLSVSFNPRKDIQRAKSELLLSYSEKFNYCVKPYLRQTSFQSLTYNYKREKYS